MTDLHAIMHLQPTVVAVGCSQEHTFSKATQHSIDLMEGLGVKGDAHNGVTVQHRSRMNIRPAPANLRQVHLIHDELLDELREAGHSVAPQQLGENVTTRNVDLLKLPTGTLLHLGEQAIVEVTGLRNPCPQIEKFQAGLQDKLVFRTAEGKLVRKCGVTGIVKTGGLVETGATIKVHLPQEPHQPLKVV